MRIEWCHYWLAFALFMAAVLSHFASESPDGLEKVAEDMGFLKAGEGNGIIQAPMPDYNVPWPGGGPLPATVAGVSGTIVVFVLAYGLTGYLGENGKTTKSGG
jgi:cobalt/nickel transport protein